MESLRAKGEKLIIAGDYNTAHQEIDLHDPKNNQNTSGFLPIERAWLNKLIEYNYIDTFRHFYPEEKDIYTLNLSSEDQSKILKDKNKK